MKTIKARPMWSIPAKLATMLALPLMICQSASSQDAKPTPTDLDLAGDMSRYFGQRANLYRDNNRKLAKLDLDADFNYDGTIDNFDPADGGAFEHTPPGLVVGVGELSKLIIRLTPYKIDYEGRAKVKLQIDGINRDEKSGKFTEGSEAASMGHIRVWRDATKKEKILDSRDPNLRSFEWTLDSRTPANLQIVPRTLYIEGLSSSPRHSGDIRLLVSVYDDNPNFAVNPKMDPRRWVKTFRPTYDHILVTVRGAPHEKAYINNNSEGVWLSSK
ncbi:MAG: hypothetical protein ABL962_15365 [Fimbriimonadaceae bacterium]